MKIKDLFAREILDSKGHPTVEAEVTLENGVKALGQVPSGVSTGSTEAVELRDNDNSRYQGKGVLKAVEKIRGPIREILVGQEVLDQKKIDELMIEVDGTENKSKLGGNAIVAVSMAVCRAAARSQKIPLFKYFGQLSGNNKFQLPQPQILVLEGGKHGDWSTDIQEYMVIPKKEKFQTFAERLEVGAEIFYSLEKILKDKNYSTGVGFEGAFCPGEIKSNTEALDLICQAIKKAGFKLKEEILLGLDAAATEFYKNGRYLLKTAKDNLTSQEWLSRIEDGLKAYPGLWSLEDMFAEEDWQGWQALMKAVGDRVQVVGDDLVTTNTKRIRKAADIKACNSVIIKPNQVGTITESLEAIKLTDSAGLSTIVSHRGGETNDDLIADLVVGTTSWQCKFGGPNRGERVAKYNRLLRIEEDLI